MTTIDLLDGGDSTDYLDLNFTSGTTFDLRAGLHLQNIESLSFGSDSGTLLIDQASLNGFTQISGSSTAQLLTDEASLDLTGISVSNIKVASTNATGTTFTVDNVNTALSIVGGPGDDTIDASTLTLSQSQRDTIFLSTSVETIHDSTGIYGNSAPTRSSAPPATISSSAAMVPTGSKAVLAMTP